MNRSEKGVMMQAFAALHSEDVDQQSRAKTALIRAITQPVEPTTRHKFCNRCGKRLGGVNDVHTCTPPKAQQ